MTDSDPSAVESIDPSNPRAQRALTECMTVLEDAPDLYTVVSESGSASTVDLDGHGRCGCPDATHNLDDTERCKHQLRALVATGRLSVPTWIDRNTVDGLLGAHVEGSPRLVATDGGVVCTADADDEPDADEERPADCECSGHPDESLPCWYCYAEGFDEPNPAAEWEEDPEGSA